MRPSHWSKKKKIHRPGRQRFRRVLPSSRRLQVFNLEAIRCLIGCGALFIAAAVRGIAVAHCPDGHGLVGVKAVIDKHFPAGLLAQGLDVDCVVITTDVAIDAAKVFF